MRTKLTIDAFAVALLPAATIGGQAQPKAVMIIPSNGAMVNVAPQAVPTCGTH